MPDLLLSKVNPEGGTSGQPTVLTFPKKTGTLTQVGDPVFYHKGTVGDANFIQEYMPISDLAPSYGTTIVDAAPRDRCVFYFGTNDQFVGYMKAIGSDTGVEEFWLTIYDRVTREHLRCIVEIPDSHVSHVDKVFAPAVTSPNGDKVAIVFAPDNHTTGAYAHLEDTNGTLAGITMCGLALTEDSVLSIPAPTTVYGIHAGKTYEVVWTDNDTFWAVHAAAAQNDLLVSTRYTTATSTLQTSTISLAGVHNCTSAGKHIQLTDAGNFLVNGYQGDVYLYKPNATTAQLTVVASETTTTGAYSYGLLLRNADGTYMFANVDKSTFPSYVALLTLDETEGSESITRTTRTEALGAYKGNNETLYPICWTDDCIIYGLASNKYADRFRVERTASDIDLTTLRVLPYGRMSGGRNMDPTQKYYIWHPTGTGLYVSSHIFAAIPVEDFLAKLDDPRTSAVYLGKALSVDADTITVAVEADLYVNNELLDVDTIVGDKKVIHPDYAVEVLGTPRSNAVQSAAVEMMVSGTRYAVGTSTEASLQGYAKLKYAVSIVNNNSTVHGYAYIDGEYYDGINGNIESVPDREDVKVNGQINVMMGFGNSGTLRVEEDV